MAMLQDPMLNFSYQAPVVVNSPVTKLKPGKNSIGAFTLQAIDAPGHSEGSTMLLWDDNLICGDVIFQGSIGRTDLPTGSNTKMMQTLRMIRETLPSKLKVYPGTDRIRRWIWNFAITHICSSDYDNHYGDAVSYTGNSEAV